MKREALRYSALAFFLSLCLPAQAEKVEELKPRGYVNDFAGVLDAEAAAQLTALCAEVDLKARAQIAAVTIRSLEGLPVEDFAIRLAQRWGVGYKGNDRGVLILLAVTDREYRVEVGYGLEPILPDGKVGGFGREMIPFLRRGDYGGALLHVTGRVADVIAADRGVSLAARPAQRVPVGPPAEEPHRPGERGAGWLAKVYGIIAILIAGVMIWGIPLLAILVVIAHVRRAVLGKSRSGFWRWLETLRMGSGSSGGSSWGGGSSGGGSFGGFGGGSFGGGGASGKW